MIFKIASYDPFKHYITPGFPKLVVNELVAGVFNSINLEDFPNVYKR